MNNGNDKDGKRMKNDKPKVENRIGNKTTQCPIAECCHIPIPVNNKKNGHYRNIPDRMKTVAEKWIWKCQ
jgi:hypothetical protein